MRYTHFLYHPIHVNALPC